MNVKYFKSSCSILTGMVKLIREYVRRLLLTESVGGRKLRIFDFDDTLVTTRSLIHVTSSSGEKFDLTPGEYAVYDKRPGDVMDYSDFSKLIDPREVVWTGRILRNLINKGSEVVILTARAAAEPVRQFLSDAGLPQLTVVALADSDPRKKAEYVARRIEEDDLDLVEFFDDSSKNVAAVAALQPSYPGTRIRSRHVKAALS